MHGSSRGARSPALIGTLLLWTLLWGVVATAMPRARALEPADQPDGWIKLCGINIGCEIDPPPHPWRGKDVHKTTGRRQTVRVDLNDGQACGSGSWSRTTALPPTRSPSRGAAGTGCSR